MSNSCTLCISAALRNYRLALAMGLSVVYNFGVLASVSQTKADFFCTCDDKLLKKSRRLKTLETNVVSPLQLIAEVTP